YRVVVNTWDQYQDPVNFPGDPSGDAQLDFTTSPFNLVPVSLTVTPPTINAAQQASFDAQLSTPFAYGTFVRQHGGTFTFLFSVQSDATGEIVIPSGLQPVGTHSILVFETPVALTAGNWQISTIGASFASAPLTVIAGVGLLGDVDGDASL